MSRASKLQKKEMFDTPEKAKTTFTHKDRASKSAEDNLAKGDVTEMCCGQLCDKDKRDAQLKLLGVTEFIRLYKRTVMLTGAQEQCIDVVASEYNMLLHPLK